MIINATVFYALCKILQFYYAQHYSIFFPKKFVGRMN